MFQLFFCTLIKVTVANHRRLATTDSSRLVIIVNSVNHCCYSNTSQNGQHNENIGEVHYYHFTWNKILVDNALIWGADTSIPFLVILNI